MTDEPESGHDCPVCGAPVDVEPGLIDVANCVLCGLKAAIDPTRDELIGWSDWSDRDD